MPKKLCDPELAFLYDITVVLTPFLGRAFFQMTIFISFINRVNLENGDHSTVFNY